MSRARYRRSGLTLCVMLCVVAAGLAGTVQAQAPQALPGGGFEFVYANETPATDGSKQPVSRGTPQTPLSSAKAFSPEFPSEVEPNGTPETATPLVFNANSYTCRSRGTSSLPPRWTTTRSPDRPATASTRR